DHIRRRLRQGSRPRSRGAAPRGARSGPPSLLSAHRVAGHAGHGGRGPCPDHARLEQLPRADRRRAGQAGRPRRDPPLRHRPDRLAAAQRHHVAAPRARGGDRRVDADRGRDRLHHRPPGEHRDARDDPRPRRHRHRRLGRPRVDPRRLPAVAGQAASVPPRAPGQAREAARTGRGGRRRRPRRRRRRLLDGGRRRAAPGDRRPRGPVRRAADGGRGPRRRRPRRPGRGRLGAARRRGPRRPAHGHVLEVARVLRRLHRRLGRGHRLPARPVARVPVHRVERPRRPGQRARRPADRALRRGPRPHGPRPRERPAPERRPARPRLQGRRARGRADADHPRAGRGRLEGRAALAGPLRRRR
ncbi:MAG: Serine palmitoyltransferase, partial [uncultured Solirubrobacteraceae bacterium]